MNPKTDRRPAETVTALRARTPLPQGQSGFCASSIILTLKGAIQIGDLAIGDKVITRDTGTAQLLDIRHLPAETPFVVMKQGTLGAQRPERDMRLTENTMLYCRSSGGTYPTGHNFESIRIDQLIDGTDVLKQSIPAKNTFVALVFEQVHIVYVDGVEVLCSMRPTPLKAQHRRSAKIIRLQM